VVSASRLCQSSAAEGLPCDAALLADKGAAWADAPEACLLIVF